MKKVLFIVYNYPPAGGSGVQRDAKFAKYLPEYGWQPIILTPHHRLLNQPRDYSLAEELPPEQIVYRTFTLDARWLFKIFWGLRLPKVVSWLNFRVFIPDAEILWLPFAKRKIKKIFREHQPELVFISAPPFSPLLLGKWLKDKYHIPYVVSFRDEWSQGQGRLDFQPPASFSAKDLKYENQVLSEASQVVSINWVCQKSFRDLHPELPEARFTVITNGYDEDDFRKQVITATPKRDYLQIVHPGALYGRSNPAIIWQALSELVSAKELDPTQLRIDLYGENYPSFIFRGYEHNPIINQIVHLYPYIPHSEVIDLIMKADLLLIYNGPGPKSEVVSTGKLFEYLRSGKPILAIVNPQGVCAETVNRAASGWIANHNSVADIRKKLIMLYGLWQEQRLTIQPDWDYIHQFDRRQLSSMLAACFDKALIQK